MHRLAQRDPKVTLAFYKVLHFLDTPPSMFMPRMMLRVLGSRAPSS